MKKLTHALKELIALIEIDFEYPEAHWLVIDRYGLTREEGEALTEMYDDCGGTLS